MLARINTAAGGIASYLETGRKRGREFDRDLIDQRLVLDGDLALVNAVIDTVQTAQEGDARYLHITLGLAERFTAADVCGPGEVNLAKLHAITDAYREALMAAYDRREYAWYAEAHIPKVSHELHEGTGEYVERLPHVHIVLPMRNLEDGKYLNPTGHGKAMVDAGFAQAIQEQINARFGLRSPAEHRRDAPHDALAKHSARSNPGTPAEIRQAVADLLRDGQVASFDALAAKLAEFGQVRVRAGKAGEYLNVKPAWAAKGINLKDITRENFAAAAAAARSAPAAAPANEQFERLASDWRERAAFEARYLTSANRSHYKKLDPQQRIAWLQEKAQASRDRLDARDASDLESLEKNHGRHTRGGPDFERARDSWRAAALSQSRAREAAPGQPAQTLASVRNLSSVPVVQRERAAEVLLHADAPDRVGRSRKAGDEVRWARAGAHGDAERRRRPITVVQTLIAARERSGPSDDRLKSDTSPSLVLEAAARLLKIDQTRYDIGSGRDGTPRILHGDRQYNLTDFFTKHLNVPWEKAKPILEACHTATLSDSLPAPDRELWRSFTAWRQQAFEGRQAARERTRSAARERLARTREAYKRAKLNARGLAPAQRQAATAAARAERLVAEAQARELARQEREAAKRPSRNAEYREFLTELANGGNLAALAELRRAAPLDREPFDGIEGGKSKPALPLPSYKVDHAGRVTYFHEGQSLVTDSAKGVAVLQRDQRAYDTALKVAVARYGKNLTLRGDRVFMDNMIAAARRSRLELVIRNADRPLSPPIRIGGMDRER